MKKIGMVFPDNTSMSNFIIREKITSAEVDPYQKTLVAPMNDKQMVIAETFYGATVKRTTSIN